MANIIEWNFKINDLGSGPMRQVANTANGVFSRMGGGAKALGSNIDALNSRIDALTKTRRMSVDSSQITRLGAELDKLEAKRVKLENSGRRAASGGLGWFRQGLAIAGIGSMAMLGKDVMGAGINRQMDATSLNTLVGQKDGTALNAQLLEFAKKSIYGGEVFNEGKLLAGSGVQATNIMPIMKMIGDIALGDKERMKSLALAFSETATRGGLTGIQERMFLQGGLFNPLEQLHKMTGRSLPDLKKDMEKGKIGITDLVHAMEYATGPMGRWHNAMKNLQNQPAGKWIALTGTIRTLVGDIGQKLLPALGRMADFTMSLIGQPTLLSNIAWGIGTMTAAWMLYTAWTERAALWSGILEVAAAWPIALLGVLGYAYKDLDKLNDGVATNTESTADRIGNAFTFMRRVFENFVYVAQTAMLGVESGVSHLGHILLGVGKIAIGDIRGGWNDITADNSYDKKIEKLRLDHEWHKAMDYSGLDDDGKPKKTTGGLMSFLGGYKPDGKPPGAVPDAVKDAADGISGGGVRNQTINIARLGSEQIVIHTTNLSEGAEKVKQTFIEMFNQVINSGNAAVNPN